MTPDQQREHQEQRLTGLQCSADARLVAWLYWGQAVVPLDALVFADEEGTVIFEWETRGCHVEMRISAEEES